MFKVLGIFEVEGNKDSAPDCVIFWGVFEVEGHQDSAPDCVTFYIISSSFLHVLLNILTDLTYSQNLQAKVVNHLLRWSATRMRSKP